MRGSLKRQHQRDPIIGPWFILQVVCCSSRYVFGSYTVRTTVYL